MRLTLQLRNHSTTTSHSSLQRPSHFNTFVKLHPQQVHQFYQQALSTSALSKVGKKVEVSNEDEDDDDDYDYSKSNYWHIHHENPSDVLFLPLKVAFTIGTGTPMTNTEYVMYVSYNGGLLDKGE